MTKPTSRSYQLTILIVDDLFDSLEVLARLLSIVPECKVLKADNVVQTIDHLLIEDIDMVFLEHNLPDIDSIELARIVRQFGQHITIHLMGVQQRPEYLAQMEDVGIASYLLKPLEEQVVFDLVEEQRQQKMSIPATLILPRALVNLGQAYVAPPKPAIKYSTRSLLSTQKDFPRTWGVWIRNLLEVEQIEPLNLIFLVDTSYSMLHHSFNPRDQNFFGEHNDSDAFAITLAEATRQLVKDLTHSIPVGSCASLMTVNHTVHMAVATQLTELASSEVSAVLDGLNFQGGTDLYLGLEALLKHVEDFLSLPGIPQIVLWTDGDISPTCLERCIPVVQKLAAAGFILHGVNFVSSGGPVSQIESLQYLISLGSGQFINAGLIRHATQNYPDAVWELLGLRPEAWLMLEVIPSADQYRLEHIQVDNPLSPDWSLPPVPTNILHSNYIKLYITLNEISQPFIPILEGQPVPDEAPDPVAQVRIRPFMDKNASWQTTFLSLDAPANPALGKITRTAPPPIFQQATTSTSQAYLAEAFTAYGYPQFAARLSRFSSSG